MGCTLLFVAAIYLWDLPGILLDRNRYFPFKPAVDVTWTLTDVASGRNDSRLEKPDVGQQVLLNIFIALFARRAIAKVFAQTLDYRSLTSYGPVRVASHQRCYARLQRAPLS
jgi:hypothetical protein